MNKLGTKITLALALFYTIYLIVWSLSSFVPGILPDEIAEVVQYRGTSTAVIAVFGILGFMFISNRYRNSTSAFAAYYVVLLFVTVSMLVLSDFGTLGCGSNCAGQTVSEQTAEKLAVIRPTLMIGLPTAALIVTLSLGLKRSNSTDQ